MYTYALLARPHRKASGAMPALLCGSCAGRAVVHPHSSPGPCAPWRRPPAWPSSPPVPYACPLPLPRGGGAGAPPGTPDLRPPWRWRGGCPRAIKACLACRVLLQGAAGGGAVRRLPGAVSPRRGHTHGPARARSTSAVFLLLAPWPVTRVYYYYYFFFTRWCNAHEVISLGWSAPPAACWTPTSW